MLFWIPHDCNLYKHSLPCCCELNGLAASTTLSLRSKNSNETIGHELHFDRSLIRIEDTGHFLDRILIFIYIALKRFRNGAGPFWRHKAGSYSSKDFSPS